MGRSLLDGTAWHVPFSSLTSHSCGRRCVWRAVRPIIHLAIYSFLLAPIRRSHRLQMRGRRHYSRRPQARVVTARCAARTAALVFAGQGYAVENRSLCAATVPGCPPPCAEWSQQNCTVVCGDAACPERLSRPQLKHAAPTRCRYSSIPHVHRCSCVCASVGVTVEVTDSSNHLRFTKTRRFVWPGLMPSHPPDVSATIVRSRLIRSPHISRCCCQNCCHCTRCDRLGDRHLERVHSGCQPRVAGDTGLMAAGS